MISAYHRWRKATSGVLGINRRNLEYVYRNNARRNFVLVDDKIRAKEILASVGVATTDTLDVIDFRGQIRASLKALEGRGGFVVKPAGGFGGGGVLAFPDPPASAAESSERQETLEFHTAAILSGMYSLASDTDRVIVEAFVEEHPILSAAHGGAGVADVRVIVYGGVPAMAMLRVPCEASRPTANLHRGGIGMGIDLATGETTYGVCRGRPTHAHPDTGVEVRGIRLPYWKEVLDAARPLNRAFGLGYLGADVVLDARKGPLVLEVNARPGLTIQVANMKGLRRVLTPVRAG